MISASARAQIGRHRDSFANAWPFKHVVIDDFFEPEVLKALVEDFPPFTAEKAMNELGSVGGKAVWEDLRAVGPRYARIQEGIASPAFREFFSTVTGISDLLHDDEMYGGGTHENVDGQELDPHVDFNYDERHGWHRRLNALVFLNPEWQDAWGGNVEFHSNPRDPERNEIVTYGLRLNRCVLFETNEHSWHGFPRIQLPPDKKHLTRRSLSIYFYTRERPADEIAPSHATFYVQRPLPRHIQPGHVLSAEDVQELQWLVRKRDMFLELHQRKELERSAAFQRLQEYHGTVLQSVRMPLQGYVVQRAAASGFHHDGWVTSLCRVSLRAERAVQRVRLEGFVPEDLTDPTRITLTAGDVEVTVEHEAPGRFEIELPLTLDAGASTTLTLRSSQTVPVDADSPDQRERSFLLRSIVFEHA